MKWLHHLALKNKTVGLDVLCCVNRCVYPIPGFLVVCVPDPRVPCVCAFTWCNCDPRYGCLLPQMPMHGLDVPNGSFRFCIGFLMVLYDSCFWQKMGPFSCTFFVVTGSSKNHFLGWSWWVPFQDPFRDTQPFWFDASCPFQDSRLHLFHHRFRWFEETWLPDGSGCFLAAFINKRLAEKEGTTESTPRSLMCHFATQEVCGAISCFRIPIIFGRHRFHNTT